MCDSQSRARSATGSGTAPSSAIGGITGSVSPLPTISKSAAAIRWPTAASHGSPSSGTNRTVVPSMQTTWWTPPPKRTRSPIRSAPRGVSPLIPLPAY